MILHPVRPELDNGPSPVASIERIDDPAIDLSIDRQAVRHLVESLVRTIFLIIHRMRSELEEEMPDPAHSIGHLLSICDPVASCPGFPPTFGIKVWIGRGVPRSQHFVTQVENVGLLTCGNGIPASWVIVSGTSKYSPTDAFTRLRKEPLASSKPQIACNPGR